MPLKRTVYRFADKDYETTDIVEFTFYIQRVSINNFLNLNYSAYSSRLTVRNISPKLGEFTLDHMRTNVDSAIKPVIVTCTAMTLFLILEKLGMREYHTLETLSLYVRNRDLRASKVVINERYNGIHVFDPVTKKSWMTSGAPKKIIGRQAIINGKLWRKYYTKKY